MVWSGGGGGGGGERERRLIIWQSSDLCTKEYYGIDYIPEVRVREGNYVSDAEFAKSHKYLLGS